MKIEGKARAFSIMFLLASGQVAYARTDAPLLQSRAQTCTATALEEWTPLERDAWAKICAGETADLSNRPEDQKVLSSQFLESVLLRRDVEPLLLAHGVQIVGARFKGPLRLAGADIQKQLWLANCVFEDVVDMRTARAKHTVSFNGSTLQQNANFYGIAFDADLELNGGVYANLNLARAVIKGQLNIVDSDVQQANIYDAEIGHSLFFNRSIFRQLLTIENTTIGGDVLIRGASLRRALIDQSKVGGVLLIGYQPPLDPEHRRLGLTGDLQSHPWKTRGAGSLTTWAEDGFLDLHGTTVRLLGITDDGWADHVDIRGLTYSGFYEYPHEKWFSDKDRHRADEANLSQRDSGTIIQLLRKQIDSRFSLQPYTQMSNVLISEGYVDLARDILYEGKEQQRKNSRGLTWLWQSLQWAITGYGQRTYRAIVWACGLIIVGALIFRSSEEAKRSKMPFGLAFSFDQLLPIVKLREAHYKIDLAGWRRYYFYFHKISGYVLLAFIVSAISGLST